MKLRIIASALLVLVLSAGISTKASAAPWRGGYRHGWVRPHVFIPVPPVVVAPPIVYGGGGYYGGGYYGGGYYGRGYYCRPHYREAYGPRYGCGYRGGHYGGGHGYHGGYRR